ncbi:hypothetical protein BVC80_379g133 [Macleaya cordata]|uniref:Uncharacterized protein n=1 Tax=Macleaya cordata TaxID=56857 RepID=A0A200QT17_MACCD|nr:hypothetical protein BVC80_379g133 [Macleaya cordata]
MQNQEIGIKVEFKQFDIVSTDYESNAIINHHFASSNPSGDASKLSSTSVKKNINREWRILENSLPDSTFVRVYEERIDLLRAVIIGAAVYINGRVKIGDAVEDGFSSSSPSVGGNAVSKKFKLTMDFVYSSLVEAFTKNGSSLENLIKHNEGGADMEDDDDDQSCKTDRVVVNRKHGFAAKAFSKLKNILGLNVEEEIPIRTM